MANSIYSKQPIGGNIYNTQVYFTKEMPLAALGFPEGSTTA
jgi:hypothetical protein